MNRSLALLTFRPRVWVVPGLVGYLLCGSLGVAGPCLCPGSWPILTLAWRTSLAVQAKSASADAAELSSAVSADRGPSDAFLVTVIIALGAAFANTFNYYPSAGPASGSSTTTPPVSARSDWLLKLIEKRTGREVKAKTESGRNRM